MRRLFVLVATSALVFALSLGGAQQITLGLSVSTLNNPFFVTLRDGAVDAARSAGVTLIVLDAQDSPAKQLNDVQDLIQRRVSAILLNPTDAAALVPAVLQANRAGVPVITVDRAVAGGQVVAHIASDNVAGGRQAAEFIAQKLNGQGNIVMLEGIPGTSAARDRGTGFREGLTKYPGLRLIASQPANFDRAQGLNVMQNILQAQPRIDAVFAQNDEMALGAIQAIRTANRTGVMVVGFDAIPDAVAAVMDGRMAATIAQQPAKMGQLGVETAVGYLRGGTVSIPVDLQLVVR
jgi:ribose transport system substrate-binding protein